jgi:glycine/D-amino acid oxidase-like deaminating enzyme
VDHGVPTAEGSGSNAGNIHVQLQSYFVKAGDPEKLSTMGPTLALLRRAAGFWREFATSLGEPVGLSFHGGLMLAETQEELATLRRKVKLEREFGLAIEMLDAAAVRAVNPHFASHVVGGALCPEEGSVNPLLANRAIVAQARRASAGIFGGAPVSAVKSDGRGFAVTVAGRRIRARRVVNAAGPWGAKVGGMLGVSIPIGGVGLHMNITAAAPPLMGHLVEHASRHLTMKQVPAGQVMIGGGWHARTDAFGQLVSPREAIEGNLWVAQRILPALAGLHLLRTWTGVAPVISDNRPILGPVPGVAGFHCCLTEYGYTLGPYCAFLVAESLLGRAMPDDFNRFSMARFAASAPSPGFHGDQS